MKPSVNRCTICRKIKPFSAFPKNEYASYGRQSRCKECDARYQKIYQRRNIAKLKQYRRNYYRKHRKQMIARAKANRANRRKNPAVYAIEKTQEAARMWARRHTRTEAELEAARTQHKQMRLKIFKHYSKGSCCCSCCGESHYEFMAIDHVNGGGAKHRKKVGPTDRWIIKHRFPRGFRILCHNCNASIGYYGYCPHQGSWMEHSDRKITRSRVNTGR